MLFSIFLQSYDCKHSNLSTKYNLNSYFIPFSKSGKRNYLPNKLKQYTIPTPLRDCVLDGEDLRELYPVLSEVSIFKC